MTSHHFSRLVISITAVLVAFPTLALAGPPLICHAIEIGAAKSLPWVDLNYRQGSGNYDLKNLSRDTLAILDSNPPVLVHMETLRRATLYARQDQQAAKELITRMQARTTAAEAPGHSQSLALFDLGYLAETYKQWLGRSEPNPAAGVDGYALVKKAINSSGEDPEMEFAAALITLTGPENAHQEHARKAITGAKNDPLLAQNLASSFNRQTIAELLRTVPVQASNK
jgi:hypothetical protein